MPPQWFRDCADAQITPNKVLEYERTGTAVDDRQMVTDYLVTWSHTKALTFKPTTMANLPVSRTQRLIALQRRRPLRVPKTSSALFSASVVAG